MLSSSYPGMRSASARGYFGGDEETASTTEDNGYPPTPPLPTPLGNQNSRSFYHSSHHGQSSVGVNDCYKSQPYYPSSSVREQTAELANIGLSDVASSVHSTSGSPPSEEPPWRSWGRHRPASEASSPQRRKRRSSLTHSFNKPYSEPSDSRQSDYGSATAGPDETSPLIAGQDRVRNTTNQLDRTIPDVVVNSHPESLITKLKSTMTWPRDEGLGRLNYKSWNGRTIIQIAVIQPASYLPAVILGLLLNVLDGLSYGMILFPLGQDIFSDLGPDGLSIFYVSCIVSQLVYSCGGSTFKGGVGSEMIEVVPFFHKMAFTILSEIGEDNPRSVRATTIVSYALSSILTGAVFFGLGQLKLGSLIGFFPRHILVGCIGGVGWFLMATGLEVSARLDGNLNYNLETLRLLFEPATIALWIVPLSLAILLMVLQRFIKHPLFVPLYFIAIPTLFHIIVAIVSNLELPDLRYKGWVFDAPGSNVPFYHFYTLYDFSAVNWTALLHTVPAMFALTFFGILHVPINVPALGVSTGEDNVDVDRELRAHGISNALSGLAGSIQNYLVYTNSILFIRSGGDSRVAGIMLAFGTLGVMAAGPKLIGYIPVMVVGALIFLLGIELLKEALYDTWRKLNKLEYLTICAIIVTMGAWDFVIGILLGIVLACVSLVVQTSRKSAIRGTYSGVVARSTVRRSPLQQRFLREVGRQIHVVKLAGYIFFGNLGSVEQKIRNLLDEQNFLEEPIRFLVVDLLHVSGIDFSAAEAFTRMQRLLTVRGVEMIMSGVRLDSDLGQGLMNVGVWSADNARVFEDLNAALEYCENEFLHTLYKHANDNSHKQIKSSNQLDVPIDKSTRASAALGTEPFYGSPRQALVSQAVATTLKQEEVVTPTTWRSFKQPLPLLLQIFHEMTQKNEDFWFKAVPFFERQTYPQGTILFRRGDSAKEFFLVEDGILRADYELEQGKYSESIVAGTTCGELPFFSQTPRTATVVVEKDVILWLLNDEKWVSLQKEHPDVAKELLAIALKLTSERMGAITSYVLTTSG